MSRGVPGQASIVDVDQHTQRNYEAIAQYLEIDPSRLPDMLVMHGAYFGFLAQYISRACGIVKDLKTELSEIKGRKFLEYQAELQGAKATIDTLKSYVAIDPEVIECTKRLNAAEADEAFFDTVKIAMQQRGFLLKELSATSLSEKLQQDGSQVTNAELRRRVNEEVGAGRTPQQQQQVRSTERDMMMQQLGAFRRGQEAE